MKKEDDNDNRKLFALILMWAVIITIVFVYLSSCRPCRDFVAPPPEVHYVHDTVKVAERHDSIIYKDVLVKDSSSFVQKGDTVTIERWHWERDYRYERILEQKIDSIARVKQDSIPYPVYVDKEVPAKMSNWQIFLITLGKVFLIVFGLALIFVLVRRKFL